MTGKEFRAIRERLGLTTAAWGRALGYCGTYATITRHIRHFESGARRIPPTIAVLARMYEQHGLGIAPEDCR
jgi:transcriptional regulator with XRE-family HTH domain